MRELTTGVGEFELVDEAGHLSSSSVAADSFSYPWSAPHWVPNPVPEDYDILTPPWIRPEQTALTIVGVNVVDVESCRVMEAMTVKMKAGIITTLAPAKYSDMLDAESTCVDAAGLYLCPGLIDCHTHITLVPGWTTSVGNHSDVATALRATFVLKGMLSRGFTTVRDVGGAGRHYREATEQWLIPGPRLFVGGPLVSQTGGHGDSTNPDDPIACCQIGTIGGAVIVDGADACLKVARKLMMAGADHVKICSSGGVASLTDKLESNQFTLEEMKAIADTVRDMGGTLVTAHCFTSEGARRAMDAGVKGIEHGNLIDKDTLKLMAKNQVHLTPTLIASDLISRPPFRSMIPPSSIPKLEKTIEMGYTTIKNAVECGVNVAYGSDTFGSMQPLQLSEFDLRAKVLPSPVILQQATINGAKVLGMEGKLGVLKPGAFADMLILSGNPLLDVTILNRPKQFLKAIVKDGRVVHSLIDSLRVEVPLV